MRPIFVFSFALNLLLATSLVLARVDASRGGTPLPAEPGSAPVGRGPLPDPHARGLSRIADGASLTDYYRRLVAAGIDHRDTLLPAAGWIYRALAAAGPLHDEYWRSTGYERDRQASTAALSESLRSELTSLYGAAAADRPEFRGLFRPLGPRFDFLTSAQQLAIADTLAAEAAARSRHARPACAAWGAVARRSATLPRSREDLPPGLGSVENRISALLGPQLRFEFALRTSPIGEPLRELGLDESSYRDAFALLDAFAEASAPDRQIAAIDALEKQLGPAAAGRVLRRFDPTWPTVAATLGEGGVTPDAVDAVYAELRWWRTETLRVLLAGLPPEELAAAVADTRQQTVRRLQSLVGEPLSEQLLSLRPHAAGEGIPDAC